MKPTQLIFALFVAAMVKSTYAIDFEWQPESDVEIPGNAAVRSPNALRRVQATTDLSSTELASSGSAIGSSASAASSTAETEAPTTIMVLLPDNLAPSYSGSGSVMFFDGSVGDDDKSKSPSASSDSVAGEASGAAAGRNFEVATALTFFTILTALVVA
ncbi:hypothetical protein KRP22_002558 [Phytophthora ramorum]|nr:hypothetical protein KRP22_6205 [Phytophthora ramorum]